MKTHRPILIAGNWKMTHGPKATARFFSDLRALWDSHLSQIAQPALQSHSLQALVFPPAVSLAESLTATRGLPIEIGSQNTHWEKEGAFTGEISGPMLQELGLKWSLVGHSERRQYCGETNESTGKRTHSLLEQGIRIMLCVGETLPERETGRTSAVLESQLQGALMQHPSVSVHLKGRLVIAYEPVWAIGTGKTATPEQAEETHQWIRKWIWDHFGMEAAGLTPILYGGSVNTQNLSSLLKCPNIDGALVGGASLKADSYAGLLEIGAQKT